MCSCRPNGKIIVFLLCVGVKKSEENCYMLMAKYSRIYCFHLKGDIYIQRKTVLNDHGHPWFPLQQNSIMLYTYNHTDEFLRCCI